MAWLSVDRAIGLALLGLGPRTVAPRATDLGGKDRGFTGAAWDAQRGDVAATPKIGVRQVSYKGVKTDIPVYRFSARGVRNVETWPCLSYELVGASFNPARYIWRADRFRQPVITSRVEIELEDQKGIKGRPASQTPRTKKVGPTLLEVRDHPEPFDLMYEVRVWSKDFGEALMLQRLLLELFPARGKLDTVQQDGTAKSWELLLQGITNVDDEEPTAERQTLRASSWVYTYVVETFLDNTEVKTLQRAVDSVSIELEQMG